jgi:hypothetical protein
MTGALEKEYPVEYEKLVRATEESLKDLKIRAVETRKDKLGGTITGSRSDGTSVKITLVPTEPEKTTLKVRVGVLGDREASEKIMIKINEELLKP